LSRIEYFLAISRIKFPTIFSCVGELWSYCATYWRTEAWICGGQKERKENIGIGEKKLFLRNFYLIEDWCNSVWGLSGLNQVLQDGNIDLKRVDEKVTAVVEISEEW